MPTSGEATSKQKQYVNKIIKHLGEDEVLNYILKFYKNIDLENLTKRQAQKIITGLGNRLPFKFPDGIVFDSNFI